MAQERKKRRVRVQGEQTCPLCRELVRPPGSDEELGVCPECETVYHGACLEQLAEGTCATIGCARRRPKTRSEPTEEEAQTVVPAGSLRGWLLGVYPKWAALAVFALSLAVTITLSLNMVYEDHGPMDGPRIYGWPFPYEEHRWFMGNANPPMGMVGLALDLLLCALVSTAPSLAAFLKLRRFQGAHTLEEDGEKTK